MNTSYFFARVICMRAHCTSFVVGKKHFDSSPLPFGLEPSRSAYSPRPKRFSELALFCPESSLWQVKAENVRFTRHRGSLTNRCAFALIANG